MSLQSLDNLVKIGQLKTEARNQLEFIGLLRSGQARLKDAMNSHALSLAVLRWHGYRSGNRYIVFQALPQTLGVGPEVWRVLSKCHDCRNLAEYEGHLDFVVHSY